MKKQYILAVLAGLGGLVGLSYSLLKKAQNMPFKPSKMTQKLIEQKKVTHDEALEALQAEFNIDNETWSDFMGLYQQNRDNDTLLGYWEPIFEKDEPEIVHVTKKLLAEYGINGDRVTIKQVNSSDTPAQTVQTLADDDSTVIHRIELDIYRLNKYTPEVQEALLRHEIMHLLNYDSLEGSYIITMLYKCGYSRQACDKSPAMIAYRHQRELRADCLASADHPAVAVALQSYFATFMKATNQDDPQLWTSHPSDKTRHEQLAQLLKQTSHVA